MAKIEPWEQRVRDEMETFVFHLNNADGAALGMHDMAQQADPENVPDVSTSDPKWRSKLIPLARKHLEVASAVKDVIFTLEEEAPGEELHEAMRPIIRFTFGLEVALEWSVLHYQYRLMRDLKEGSEKTHPLETTGLVFALDSYMDRYFDLVHLGICRHCGIAYVKPKHGRKQRYCSRSCQQKAYLARKAERDGKG
jgi:hypothetical protein